MVSSRSTVLLAGLVTLASAASCAAPSSSSDGADESDLARAKAFKVVGLADVSVAASGGLLMPGFSYSHEGVLAVLTPRYDAGQVISSTSIDGVRFVSGGTLPWPAGDVTGADVSGRRMLYLVTGAGFAASSLEGLQINPPVVVELAGSPVVPYWPQAVGLPDGRTLLTFVEPQKRAFVAVSDASGTKFEVKPFPTDVAGDLRGVLAHPGITKSGSWVVTHQIADAQWMFSSFVQLSRDAGKTWSKPKNIQPEDPNIHDASVLTRTDEGADLYYLRASTPAGFNVHRRALHEDGSLGPEQLVTSAAVGHVEKPQARRLPDGRIALVFAIKRTERTFDVGVTILSSDAPAK